MDQLKSFLTRTLTPSTPVFVIGALVVLLVPILLHIFLTRSKTYITLPSILLVGPSGAGKTSLLTLFERQTSAPTHTSQAPATVELAVSEDGSSSFRDDLDASGSTAKKFLLIDTPGHAKLRTGAMSYLAQATNTASKLKAVVFMVDAGALSEHDSLAATASYLHDVLLFLQKRMAAGKSSKAPAAVPVLIAANKADLFTALPAALVKSNLEAELGRIRRTKSKGLLDSGVRADDAVNTSEGDDWLGEYGAEKFAFSQMREFDIDVDVIAGNALGEGPGVDRWWKWMADKI